MPFMAIAMGMTLATTALADNHVATGEEIRDTIGGNTVQGSMIDGSGYTEFYAADGTIRGAGYTGTWSIEEDRMCFGYRDEPADCFGVVVDGDQVTWMKSGTADGTGTILTGNPNNF